MIFEYDKVFFQEFIILLLPEMFLHFLLTLISSLFKLSVIQSKKIYQHFLHAAFLKARFVIYI